MPNIIDDSNKEFTVKESESANLIIGCFFLILFGLILYNLLSSGEHVHNDYSTKTLDTLLVGTFVSAITFIIKGFMHKPIIVINEKGIFAAGELKTNWQNFISAEATEEQVTGDYHDHFIVLIYYYKEGAEGYFLTKIPMLNTYNKSGEEVVDAIKLFSGLKTAQTENRSL